MAKKVLPSLAHAYTLARYAGLLHESWVAHNQALTPQANVTVYGQGEIINNSITDELGLILDDESEYFYFIAQVHRNRLIDIIPGDGWHEV